MCQQCKLTGVGYFYDDHTDRTDHVYGMVKQARTAAELYALVVKSVLTDGIEQDTRLGPSKEHLDATLILTDPRQSLPPLDRNANVAIGIAEGLQLVAGISDPRLMERVAKAFARYQDGSSFWGAYGVRTASQFPWAARKLMDDTTTRQAVVTLWDPAYDNVPHRRDYPCTVSFTFRIRNEKLELKTHMRSNDIWLGLPYDIMQFTILQLTMANVIGVEPGPYVHHVDSLHLYASDYERAAVFATTDLSDVGRSMHQLDGVHIAPKVGSTEQRWWKHAAHARQLLDNEPDLKFHSDGEYFMHAKLREKLDANP